jgi:hypothetical protein
MSRAEKRKASRKIQAIVYKAKQDMQEYVQTLQDPPTAPELRAWQAGYIAGLNRASLSEDPSAS